MINFLENEKILLTKRRHWFEIVIEGAFLFLLGFTPIIGFVILVVVYPEAMNFLKDYWIFILFYGVAWLQFLWMVFSITWTNYYLDILLITNKRIIDIEQLGLFARDLAELRIENVQDIKVEVIGLIPSLLKTGNIHIQTSGQVKEFFLRNIPNPHNVAHIISVRHDELSKENSNSK